MTAFQADRKIGVNPHFSVHVLSERQVLLLSEHRSFRLNGKLYVALLDHLDGSRTLSQVLAAFAGRLPEERLRAALANMLDKGYAGYLDAAAPASRQALWVELGLSPIDAERHLAGRRIAVKAVPNAGATREAAGYVRRALKDIGLPPVAQGDADLLLVCVDDHLNPALAAFHRRMRRSGRSWMPFKPGGSEPRLGPLFRPDAAPCWTCLARALEENRPGDRLVAAGSGAIRPARAYSTASLMAASGTAVLELARLLAGGSGVEAERTILAFEDGNRTASRHLLRAAPACPDCGEPLDPARALRDAQRPLRLQSRELARQSDGGWRIAAAADVVRRLEPYVSPLTGLIAGLEDRSPKPSMPVIAARQAMPGQQAGPRQNRLVGRPAGAAGKGRTLDQARASCLAEAVERYLCGFTGLEPRRRATRAELEAEGAGAAPHPGDCLNFSDRQYAAREDLNKTRDGFNWIPERFDDSRAIEWTPAWSLTHGAVRWLPSRYCFFSYTDMEVAEEAQNRFCAADSNGCASGSTLEEAILQGFLELVERDACGIWWYNRAGRPAFDLAGADDPFLQGAVAQHAALGRSLQVLDLTTDLRIPVAIAVSARQKDDGGIILGLGAHPDAEIAIGRALSEANQMLGMEDLVATGAPQPEAAEDAVLMDWLTNRTLDSEAYCRPVGRIGTAAYERPRIADIKEAVEACIARVTALGLETIVLDHSRPDIDFAAARVVVPGLRHFWARLREGRLYDAPVAMGWQRSRLTEDQMNPIPFFL